MSLLRKLLRRFHRNRRKSRIITAPRHSTIDLPFVKGVDLRMANIPAEATHAEAETILKAHIGRITKP